MQATPEVHSCCVLSPKPSAIVHYCFYLFIWKYNALFTEAVLLPHLHSCLVQYLLENPGKSAYVQSRQKTSIHSI